MPRVPMWRRYQRFFGLDIRADVNDELGFHLDAKREELMGRGMSPSEASAEAIRQFGSVAEVYGMCVRIEKDRAKKMAFRELLSSWLQDLRYAGRRMRQQPTFTLAAVSILALGIGLNSAVFTVVHTVILRSLPFHNADRLCWVWVTNPRQGFDRDTTSYPRLQDWRSESRAFESLTYFAGSSFTLTDTEDPQQLQGAGVQANFFDVLGAQPVRGRGFQSGEDEAGRDNVIVLSHRLWASRFGADPDILGRTLQLDSRPYRVIGVAAPSMTFPDRETQYWVPLVVNSQSRSARGMHWLRAVGRLRPGVSIKEGQQDMSGLAKRLEAKYREDRELGVLVVGLKEELTREARPALLLLMAAALGVFLIAAANVSGIVVARAADRKAEIAVRTALGAGRGRLVRQLLTETVSLFALGGIVALGVAYFGIVLLKNLTPPSLAVIEDAKLNPWLVLLTIAVSVLAGIASGLRLALESARKDLAENLSIGRRTATGGFLGRRFRQGLVTVQIALSVVLLMGGGLLIRSFLKLQSVQLGFDADKVLLGGISLPKSRYPHGQHAIGLYNSLLSNLSSRPGIDGAATSTSIFLSSLPNSGSFNIEGRDERISMPMTTDSVSPSFFQVLRIHLRRGRFFTGQDRAESLPVAIINETAANRYWPKQDPIGKRFTFGDPSDSAGWLTVIGVVADTRRAGLENPVFTESYQPLAQRPRSGVALIVRGGPAEALPSIIRSELRSLDPQLPISSMITFDEVLGMLLAPRRFNTVLLGLFAATALLLAVIGVYGILAQFVASRQREIGIRMAVGADRRHVIGAVVAYGVSVLGVGLALGFAGAFASARLLSGMLYGIETWDSLTIGVVVALLAVAVAGASFLPALRATRIDPLTALRSE